MNIKVEDGEINELNQKIFQHGPVLVFICDCVSHFQGDCLYGNDDDVSTLIIGQMHHILSVTSPITEMCWNSFKIIDKY